MRYVVAIPAVLLLAGCVATVAPPRVEVAVPAPEVYVPPPPPPVVSVYVEPPIDQPPPIAVGWAPPPMLVESPPPPPFPDAVWVGGYWVWQGNWVWAHGHWMAPPRPRYVWVHPYYEHRDGVVIFVTGHWAAPGVAFVPPAPGLHLTVEVALSGVVPGPRPIGPNGCFVPPPPGSRPGFIVPAPVGTPPAVVTGAPPVVAVGMRITNNNTTINNRTTNVTNVTNITNVTNVTIVAPPGATAGGKAFTSQVPAQAHLAAAQPAVVKALAPEPATTHPIPSYRPGSKPVLPAAQAVNVSNSPQHPTAAQSPHAPAPSGPRPEMRNKPELVQNNHGPNGAGPGPGMSPNGAPNGGRPGIQRDEHEERPAGSAAPNNKPPLAANKTSAKPQQKTDHPPNVKKDSKQPKKDSKEPKKDANKDHKKEREGEPGR